jgi:hypothetical protein
MAAWSAATCTIRRGHKNEVGEGVLLHTFIIINRYVD